MTLPISIIYHFCITSHTDKTILKERSCSTEILNNWTINSNYNTTIKYNIVPLLQGVSSSCDVDRTDGIVQSAPNRHQQNWTQVFQFLSKYDQTLLLVNNWRQMDWRKRFSDLVLYITMLCPRMHYIIYLLVLCKLYDKTVSAFSSWNTSGSHNSLLRCWSW